MFELFANWYSFTHSGIGGLYAIKNKEVPRHRQWMTWNFALAVAAAVLRFLWAIYSWMYPDKNMGEINLITFQWIVILGLIASIYIASFGDPENQRGFKRFLASNIENERSHKALLGLVFMLVLNTFTTGVLGGMEYAFGSLEMYEWIGYDTSKHTGDTSAGLIIFWIVWLIGSYMNILLLWYYRYDNYGWFYAKYFDKYFIFVSIWNLLTCVVSIVNLTVLDAFYDGVIERAVFFKNIEWFWIIVVVYVLMTNLECLYYYFRKKDVERCYEWMVWMVWCTGLCFIVRYLYIFVIFGVFKALYGKGNLQDLMMSGYTSYYEVVYIFGLFWMIKETQSVKENNKYEVVETTEV